MIRAAGAFVLAQAGWLGCVGGAAAGRPWLGAAAGLASAALLLPFARDRAGTLKLMLLVALAGPLADALQIALGTVRPVGPVLFPHYVPLWLWSLWPLFAATVPLSFSWLTRRPLLAAAMGAVFGPIAYAGGARLGACELHPDVWKSFAAIGLQWGIMFPLIVRWAAWLVREPHPEGAGLVPSPQEASTP